MSAAPLSTTELARRTYDWERIRAPFTGILELIWQPGAAVALLVAIRYFDAGAIPKSFISASGFIGFLLTPVTLSLLAHSRLPATRAMAALFIGTGLLLLGIPWIPGLTAFVALVSLAHIVMVQYVPLYTDLYRTHFTTDQRGHRIGTVFIIVGAVGFLGNLGAGTLLDASLDYFRPLLVLCAGCAFVSAFCLSRIPSTPLDRSQVGHPLRNLSLAWKDRLFGWMLSSWMLLGFGNLMTLPLRTEYMANPRFGINADNQTILFITGALPLLVRLVMTRLLGGLFDRCNLVTLRVGVNLLFLLSLVLFFNSSRIGMLALGMALLGAAMAGGKILWSLWVTKLAPPEKTSAYMSVHMLCTGFRGTLSPFIGFAMLETTTPARMGNIGALLVLAATLMFLPARRHVLRRGREKAS